MKTSGWVASAIGAVVVVGGGIWAATTLPANDETAYTGAYEPAITETPEASPEPVETPAVEPSEAPETVVPTPTVEYTEAESEYLYGAQATVQLNGVQISDADLLAAGYEICEQLGDSNNYESVRVVDGLDGTVLHNDLNSTARSYLCPLS